MDLTFPPEAEAFRAEVRAFLRANLPADWQGLGALGGDDAEEFSEKWRRTLAEHGMIGITWPVEYGGHGRSKLDQVVLAQEFAEAAASSRGAEVHVDGLEAGDGLVEQGDGPR